MSINLSVSPAAIAGDMRTYALCDHRADILIME